MKINFTKTFVLIGLLGVMFGVSAARAATTSYNDGDLMLGFTASSGTGSSSVLVVDLGNYASYSHQSTFALSIGNLGTDLSNTFGSGWATNPNLSWGIVGTDESASDAFGTRAETTFGTQATAWTNKNVGLTATAAGNVENIGSGFTLNNSFQPRNTTGNTTNATVESTTDTNSMAGYLPTLASFFNATPAGVMGSFSATTGTSNSALDLFRATAGGSGASSYQGTFTISSTGQVTYNAAPVGAAPEPGRMALLALGFAGACLRRRRK